MANESSITKMTEVDNVRFTQGRLSVLSPPDRKRLENRVGVVQGYWNHTRKLTVYFPADGDRSELRILSVDPRQLERVSEEKAKAETPPQITEETSGDAKLSQEDTDNLFG
jgi:hypothetical protein